MIALVRDPSSATGLQAIDNPRLHILKADITDAASVKVHHVSVREFFSQGLWNEIMSQAAAEETAKVTGGSLDVLIHNAVYRDPARTFHNIVQL